MAISKPTDPLEALANNRGQTPFILLSAARYGSMLLNTLSAERYSMKYYSFEILIEKEPEDEGYYAYSPTMPGCFGSGKTIEEAKRNMRIAISQHVEALLARGQPIPQNEHLVHVEELTVGVPT